MVALPASSPFPRLQICLAVVVHDGQVLEKPADRDEVRANIKKYAVSAAFSVPYIRRWRGVQMPAVFCGRRCIALAQHIVRQDSR